MRQSDLAQAVGISPSYLNLIEHNRRRIAGRLLGEIARALGVDAGLLVDGAERAVIEKMQAAASSENSTAEIERTEELAARYPGWSKLIAEQADRINGLEGKIHELTARMSHDPSLAASLHAVISAVTSIRSAASILTSDEKLDADWQARFHKNIHNDAVRLARDSEALVNFLEQPATDEAVVLPHGEVDEWFSVHQTQVRSLELDPSSLQNVVGQSNLTDAAKGLLENQLITHLEDSEGFSFEGFSTLAKRLEYNPAAICDEIQRPLVSVLRRLSFLRPEDGHPVTGLAVCDGSGALLSQKRTPNFALYRGGNACANWPIFAAMGQLGRPIFCDVSMPGTPETKFRCYAIAEQSMPRLGSSPVVRSTMLVISDPPMNDAPVLEVGPTCRICPRSHCAARREDSVLDVPL